MTEEENEDDENIADITTVDFDEDAEVQARIWNSFNRGQLEAKAEENALLNMSGSQLSNISKSNLSTNSKRSALSFKPQRPRERSINSQN